MLYFFWSLFFFIGCGAEEKTEEASNSAGAESSEGALDFDERDRNISRDLIINAEFSHIQTIASSEYWVGEPISTEFGKIMPQAIHLHVRKGDSAEEFMDPSRGTAVVKVRFVLGEAASASEHGFKDAEGRAWELKSVVPAKDFPREITLLVKLKKPRLDQGQWIWKGDMAKVERGQFLKQRFILSVSKDGAFDGVLPTEKAPIAARIAFKRVFNQSATKNGFIDRANRVWEIAHAELVR